MRSIRGLGEVFWYEFALEIPGVRRLIFEPDDYDERFGRLWRLPS